MMISHGRHSSRIYVFLFEGSYGCPEDQEPAPPQAEQQHAQPSGSSPLLRRRRTYVNFAYHPILGVSYLTYAYDSLHRYHELSLGSYAFMMYTRTLFGIVVASPTSFLSPCLFRWRKKE